MVKNGYLYKLIWIFVKTHHDFIVIYQMFWCFYISMWTEKIDIIESELYWCFFLFNAMVWNPFWSSILVTNSIFLSLQFTLKLFLIRSNRVSVQGVKSLGGHFACLCRGFEFYEVEKKFCYYFSKRKWKYFYTFNHFYSEKSSKRAK